MSPLPRFKVNVMIGRTLTLELTARDMQTAEDIAQYLWQCFGDRHFCAGPEEIYDFITDPIGDPVSPEVSA